VEYSDRRMRVSSAPTRDGISSITRTYLNIEERRRLESPQLTPSSARTRERETRGAKSEIRANDKLERIQCLGILLYILSGISIES
jgi:hypothetical protein